MEWRDEGIVLGTRKHGETSVILEVMTHAHGRHLGMVRGGRSRKQQPTLQPGNLIEVLWRARLDEHMGTFQAEALELNAARLFDSASAIFAIQTLAAHLRLLPERDPHTSLYEALKVMIAHLDQPQAAGELVVRFEILLLEELGFGLDLTQCVVTGSSDNLHWVSPKSGAAVSQQAGEAHREKLLRLPAFVLAGGEAKDWDAIFDGLRLTGHFLARDLLDERRNDVMAARERLVERLRRAA